MRSKRLLLMACFMASTWGYLFAQVENLSYEVGGGAEYNFFDEQAGIEDGIFIGGEFGFGLGQFLELHGFYSEGINLKRDFSGLQEDFSGLPELDLDAKRYGGDLQINFLKTALKPYMTIGAGVQELGGNNLETNQSLFFRGGLGLLLTANDRYAWNLFGQINSFRSNPYNSLMTAEERAAYNIDLAEKDYENLINYAVGTKLVFYLGGRDPDEMTELDRALERSLSSGIKGLALEFEPTYSWVNFNDDLPYLDGQAIGAKLGVDFGQYFGVRAFYNRMMEDGEFLEFVPLTTYGIETVYNLNEPDGIVPFITLGGGYLNVGDDYVGRETSTIPLESKAFATGGLGLRVPLADVFLLKGSVKSMLMTTDDISEAATIQDINTSWLYEVGVEFKLGSKPEKPEVIEMSEYDKALYELDMQAELEKTGAISNADKEIKKLKKEIKKLKKEAESEAAKTAAKEDKAVEVEVEVENPETKSGLPENHIILPKLEDGEVYIRFGDSDNTINRATEKAATPTAPQAPIIMPMPAPQEPEKPEGLYMQPDELKEFIKSLTPAAPAPSAPQSSTKDSLNQFLKAAPLSPELQQELNDMKVQNKIMELQLAELAKKDSKALDAKQKELESKIANLESQLSNQASEREALAKEMAEAQKSSNEEVEKKMANEVQDTSTQSSFLEYKHASGMAIIGLGDANGLGVGFRTHYGIKNTKMELVPQVYFGVAGQSQYGFDFNVLSPVLQNRFGGFKPYVGLGLGLAGLEAENSTVDNKMTFNIVLGTKYSTDRGDFYFDYTNRNVFNMNQLSAGYIFKF